MLEWFQSRPGRPGRFASRSGVLLTIPLIGFNPDRAAQAVSPANPTYLPRHSSLVSIPTGPPRPFRPPQLQIILLYSVGFNPDRAAQAVSPLRHWRHTPPVYSFNPDRAAQAVSPTNSELVLLPGHRFNPDRAAQAVSPVRYRRGAGGPCRFQSRPGRPGRFATRPMRCMQLAIIVSIPTGPPRPFRPKRNAVERYCQWPFQSRPGRPGRFASTMLIRTVSTEKCFNPDRAAQAVSPICRGRGSKNRERFQSRPGRPGRFAPQKSCYHCTS